MDLQQSRDHDYSYFLAQLTLKLTLKRRMCFKEVPQYIDRCDFVVLWLKIKPVLFYITVESCRDGTLVAFSGHAHLNIFSANTIKINI